MKNRESTIYKLSMRFQTALATRSQHVVQIRWFSTGIFSIFLVAAIALFDARKGSQDPDLAIPTVIDIGRLRVNESKSFKFIIQNFSRKDVTVTRVSTSCGCSSLELKGCAVMLPGSSRVIVGKIASGDYMGAFAVTGSVEYKMKNGNVVTQSIPIRGVLIKPLVIQTRSVDFAKVEQSRGLQEITVNAWRGNSTDAWDNIQVEEAPGLSTFFERMSASEWRLHVQLDPNTLPIGRFRSALKLHLLHEGKDASPPLELPVAARICGLISLDRDSVYLNLSRRSNITDADVMLRSATTDLTSIHIATDCPFIEAEASNLSGHEAVIHIHASSPPTSGVFKQHIFISLNGVVTAIIDVVILCDPH